MCVSRSCAINMSLSRHSIRARKIISEHNKACIKESNLTSLRNSYVNAWARIPTQSDCKIKIEFERLNWLFRRYEFRGTEYIETSRLIINKQLIMLFAFPTRWNQSKCNFDVNGSRIGDRMLQLRMLWFSTSDEKRDFIQTLRKSIQIFTNFTMNVFHLSVEFIHARCQNLDLAKRNVLTHVEWSRNDGLEMFFPLPYAINIWKIEMK